MRGRRLLLAAVAAAATAPAAGDYARGAAGEPEAAGAATAAGWSALAAAGPGSVRVLECTPALDPAARSVTFEARMRPVRRSVSMALRFTLQTRAAGERWRRVDAEGFDAWLVSEPSVRRFIYDKTIRNLAVPASYRTVVRFRWLDEDGAAVAVARAASAACAQPDTRPDLQPRRLEVRALEDPALRRYSVVVRNAGAAQAPASSVRFDVAGRSASSSVPALAPGEARVATVVAPACTPGADLVVTVDAGEQVDEADEAGNALAASCPV